MAEPIRLVDGSLDFSLGCDSSRVTTVQSQANPNGLARQKLAWMVNCTVRNGAIEQRRGLQFITKIHDGSKPYQGGWLYEQQTGSPYLVVSIGGVIYAVRVDTDNSVVNLSAPGNLTNNATIAKSYMCQGESYLVMQSGDWQPNNNGTLPLFWDGTTLRRSLGVISTNNVPTGVQPYNEIPSALAMCYYQGRIWYSNGRIYTAGDIVGDTASGTLATKFTDSVLKVTENPLAIGGDGFTVPSQAGNITALAYNAQLDSALGQGTLYAFTRSQINGLTVPVSRTNWIAATNANQPFQFVAQNKRGTPSDRSIVQVNSDLFYTTNEPGLRSLVVATRYFKQWGNVPVSRNVQRAYDFTTANLLGTASGINFDNRLLMTAIPVVTPVGVAYQGLVALNFDLVSTLGEQLPPAFEGLLDGFDVLQMFEGDFGGIDRAFAIVHDRSTHDINLFEITNDVDTDYTDNRVQWQFETPAFTFGKEMDLKNLDAGEIWVDRARGRVTMKVEYRQDASACWQKWYQTEFCTAKTECNGVTSETVSNPICYPIQPLCDGYKWPIQLPRPRIQECDFISKRPASQGYQFQVRIEITGFCRIRGILLYATKVDKPAYDPINCQ